MTLYQLKNKNTIKIYNSESYELISSKTLDKEYDNFLIHNSFFFIKNGSLFSENNEELIKNIKSYTAYKRKLFFIAEKTFYVFDLINNKKIKIGEADERCQILVINEDILVLWYEDTLITHNADKENISPYSVHVKKFNSCMKFIQPIKDVLIIIDKENDIHLFNYMSQQVVGGFKSLGTNVVDMCVFEDKVIIGTEGKLFIIQNKKLLRKVKVGAYEKIIRIGDKILLIGANVHEYNIKKEEIRRVIEDAEDSKFIYVEDEIYDMGCCYGRVIEEEELRSDIIDMKIEFRKELFNLKMEIERLKNIINKQGDK